MTKETCQTFNQNIPDEPALEHVNKAGKVAGGMVRLHGQTQQEIAGVDVQ